MLSITFKQLIIHTIIYFIFAFLYYSIGFNSENYKLDNEKTQTNNFRSCLHYTLVTHSTVGYGDCYVRSTLAKAINSVHITLIYFVLAGIISFKS